MTHPKVSLVTGGGAGLGRAIAYELAKAGHRVAVADIDDAGAEETAAAIRRSGGDALYGRVDVTRPDQVEAFVQTTVATFGGLDNAVNNAGIEGVRAKITEYEVEDWTRVISVNLIGVFVSMKYEIPHIAARGGGSVVNIGSTASLRGVPLMSAYDAAKQGLVGLTKSAALEFADRQVRVNAVCPGSFRTPMSERLYGEDMEALIAGRTPMKRMGSLEEIAAPVVWLCSNAAAFVSGTLISVDGARTAGPMMSQV